MSFDPSAPVDLPVLWWVFWLAVMSVGIFVAFALWLTRQALREDAAPREEAAPREHAALREDAALPAGHEHRRPDGPPDELDQDGSAR